MNIFTKDDYRKIQAWLKANSIKDSDLTSVDDTIPEEDTLVLVQKINGILSNVKISIKNLLNSTLSKIIIDTIIANAVKINNTLTVTASNVKIDNEKGTTLQDIIDWAETIENNLENKIKEVQHTVEGNTQNIEVLQNVEDYDILVSGNTEVSPNADSVDIRIQNLDINGPSTNVETINIPAATESKAGVMSAEDKSKLDEIVALKGDIPPLTEEELDEILEDNGSSIFPPVGDFEE